MNVPIHTALLDLRCVYDRCFIYLNQVLNDEIREVTFRWNGHDIMHFDVVLAPIPPKRDAHTDRLNGILFNTRTVSGTLNKDAMWSIIGRDFMEAESMCFSLSALHTLNDALWELSLPITDLSAEKPHLLSFNARSFEARPDAFKALHENWDNYNEVCAAAHSHYQARMNTIRGLLHLTPGPLDFLQPQDEGADEQAPWGNN